MNEKFQQWKEAAIRLVWPDRSESLPAWKAFLCRTMQIGYALVRDLLEGQMTLRAMSLVYTTLLSLVPLLALAFSVLKGFGVHNQLEPILLNFLAPLGEKGAEISGKIIEFVSNIKVGVLGTVGLGLLVYTVVSLLHKIEKAFNYIWHIEQSRQLRQRFSEYLSVIMVGPLLVFSALGITASMMSSTVVQGMMAIPGIGMLVTAAGKLLPYALMIAAFTFIYIFVPNTRVKLGAALAGGVVSGVLWEATGWAFSSFVAGSSNYTAIYSGFAIVIMFMIWLFISWLILLFGASIAFYTQHPEHLGLERRDLVLTGELLERMSVLTMVFIGRKFLHQRSDWQLEDLIRWLGMPLNVTQKVLEKLHGWGLLVPSSDASPPYVPAMDLEAMQVKKILDAARSSNANRGFDARRFPSEPVVEDLLADVDRAVESRLQGQSLKDLILKTEPPASDIPESSN